MRWGYTEESGVTSDVEFVTPITPVGVSNSRPKTMCATGLGVSRRFSYRVVILTCVCVFPFFCILA
jgi:hypothetical protein